MFNILKKLFKRNEVNIGIASFGYKGKKYHWYD